MSRFIQEVSPKKLGDVIEQRVPLGLFLAKEGGCWVAVDNRDGDAWTEDFQEKNQAVRWLLDENDDDCQKNGGISMRILVIEPERRPEVREIDDSLEAMQEIVGGLIQALYPFDEPVALVCNDEGKLLGLPANRGLRDKDDQVYDVVCGTFFLCSAPADSDSFSSLSPEQIKKYREHFDTPEMFWGMDGRIVCLPLEID